MLNFALCDDNLCIVTKLAKMLEAIFIDSKLPGEIVLVETNPDKLLQFIDTGNTVDVLLIDIDLKSTINGIDLVNKIRTTNKAMYIIFTTAHLEYGILAYKCKTFDFLPKPITSERLRETILRIFEDVYDAPKKFIKIDNKRTFIAENSVCYIKKDGMKLVFKTKSRDYQIYSSFSSILNSLAPNFVRCHKSYIVNLDNITDIQPKNNLIIFNNNPNIKCYIGPKYKENLMGVLRNDRNFEYDLDKFNDGERRVN